MGVSVGQVKYSPGMWHIRDLFTLSLKSWMRNSTHCKDSQPDANNLGCKCWTTIYFPSFANALGSKIDMEINKNLTSHPLDRLITTSNFKAALGGFHPYQTKDNTCIKKGITPCYASIIVFPKLLHQSPQWGIAPLFWWISILLWKKHVMNILSLLLLLNTFQLLSKTFQDILSIKTYYLMLLTNFKS